MTKFFSKKNFQIKKEKCWDPNKRSRTIQNFFFLLENIRNSSTDCTKYLQMLFWGFLRKKFYFFKFIYHHN